MLGDIIRHDELLSKLRQNYIPVMILEADLLNYETFLVGEKEN